MNALPPELKKTPHQYVAVSGLNVVNTDFHKSIRDALIENRRSDRLPLHFSLVNERNTFPKAKPKRTSYDQYVPRGILKKSWMWKHLYSVPAVVVLFMDLDWDDASWVERKQECASKVESIRHSLEGRSTRVAVVLVQSKPPLPPGEDPRAAERATELCSVCDISPKSLFVLPQSDQLFGFILRLEHAFYELAQSYYQSELKRIKGKRDYLNKEWSNHQSLIVRYHFKLGFFNEVKQDTVSALKNYKQAYAQLIEMNMPIPQNMEFKAVGEVLNFKICKLSFQSNTPLDSISQFKKHVEAFKDKTGSKELDFEHSAWLSAQFSAFADLFDEAIQNSLAAIQTQHPGFYYQSAANHAIARKTRVGRLKGSLPPYPSPDPLAVPDSEVEYFGQRPWRVKGANQDGRDLEAEKAGILALQWKELDIDHSSIVVGLLSSAMNHFKRHRCPRMKRFIMVQLGEEHLANEDYAKALQLLSHTIWEYRAEKWFLPLREILLRALKCAYAIANIKEYVTLSLELLGRYIRLPWAEKERIQKNLGKVLNGQCPHAEIELSSDVISRAEEAWKKELTDRCFLMIQMQSIASCIEAKCTFGQAKARSDKPLTVLVYLRICCPFSMQFSKLSVTFNIEHYNSLCTKVDPRVAGQQSQPGAHDEGQDSSSEDDLHFEPNQLKVFQFQFTPRIDDVDKAIEITSLALDMGNLQSSVYGSFHWEGGGGDVVSLATYYGPEYLSCNTFEDAMDRVLIQPSVRVTRVMPRRPEMEIELLHSAPVLIGEIYPVKLHLRNTEPSAAESISIEACVVPDGTTDDPGSFCVKFDSDEKFDLQTSLDISQMEVGEMVEPILVLRSFQSGTKFVKLAIYYNLVVNIDGEPTVCKCMWTESLVLQCIMPLHLEASLLTMKMETVEELVVNDFTVLSAQLNCTSVVPISLKSVEWRVDPLAGADVSSFASKLSNIPMKLNESVTTCCTLRLQKKSESPLPLGDLIVQWSRQKDDGIIETVLKLPVVGTEFCPILLRPEFPAYGSCRTPLTLAYYIENTTSELLEVNIRLDSSESFMFSGHKQTKAKILPSDKLKLQYILLPLVAGNELLPRLKVDAEGYSSEVTEKFSQRNVPSRMFILPTGNVDSQNDADSVEAGVVQDVVVAAN